MADVPPPPVLREDEEQRHLVSRSPSPPPIRHEDNDEDETEDEEEEQHHFSRSPSPQPIRHPALELFPDGAFVRLRSRATGKYVHADDDWVGVSLRPRGRGPPALTALWLVHHWIIEDDFFVQLQGAAYGRYLALSSEEAPPPGHRHLGDRVVQRDLLGWNSFMWEVERVGAWADAGGRHDYVNLFNSDRKLALRANGGWYFARNRGVTAGPDERRWSTAMMEWTVEVVPASPAPIPLRLKLQATQIHRGRRRCSLLSWRHGGHEVRPHPPRTICYVRADDDGNFNRNHHEWPSFVFYDYSVFNLRAEVALRQDDWDWNGDFSLVTLCAWPGFNGRLMPLISDLPRSEEPMYIVVLTTGTPATETLVYPQI